MADVHTFRGAPVLHDGTVTLRPHRQDDLEAVVEMCRDPQFARWTTVPQPYTRDDGKRFLREVVPAGWERGDHRGWAIEALDDDGRTRFAGNVDVRGVPVSDVGFGLHPWARGRGVMTRAVRVAAGWAFEHGGVAAIHWRADVGNLASRRVAWACGFTFHGTVPKLLPERGQVVDAWIGSLLPGQEMTPRMRWLQPPVLRGEQVVLRPFRDSDAALIVEACTDPRTRNWLPDLPDPYTEQTAREYVLHCEVQQSLGAFVGWALADPTTGDLLGNVSVMDLTGPDPSSGEIGYWTHPAARGRGAMTEAVRLVAAHAFAPVTDGGLGLARLTLGTAVGNTASQHVARRAGFTEVGRHRSAIVAEGGRRLDAVWFDRLPSDPG